jgi:hypothetical protein
MGGRLIALLVFAGTIAAYVPGSTSGAALLLVVGVVLESLGWYRVSRGAATTTRSE